MAVAAHHRRVELQLNEVARRHFGGFPGVYHVPLATVHALGRGDLEAGETVLNKLFEGHMAGPRSVAVSGLRVLGNGSTTAGRKVLEKFLARAVLHQQAAAEPPITHAEGGKAKASKSAADYTDHGTKQEHCSVCRHYVNPGSCEIVAGHIQPQGWCRYFEKEAA
jgi:hypothetical protein